MEDFIKYYYRSIKWNKAIGNNPRYIYTLYRYFILNAKYWSLGWKVKKWLLQPIWPNEDVHWSRI